MADTTEADVEQQELSEKFGEPRNQRFSFFFCVRLDLF